MSHLKVESKTQYDNIISLEYKTANTQWSRYFYPIEISVDEIAEEFITQYDGRFFMLRTYQILLYKLFGNKDIEFYSYYRLITIYEKIIFENNKIDDLYEATINFLMKDCKIS
jgi:hypothetical protein